MTNEQLQKLREEARRFGRALTDAETQWALREHKRIYFECAIADLTWDARLMYQAQERLHAAGATMCGRFFSETEPPAIWVIRTNEGKWLIHDGHHRVAAALKMGKTHIQAFHE